MPAITRSCNKMFFVEDGFTTARAARPLGHVCLAADIRGCHLAYSPRHDCRGLTPFAIGWAIHVACTDMFKALNHETRTMQGAILNARTQNVF